MVQIKKILNNFNYNRTFTLLKDQYFLEKLEQYQFLQSTLLQSTTLIQCILVHSPTCPPKKRGFKQPFSQLSLIKPI